MILSSTKLENTDVGMVFGSLLYIWLSLIDNHRVISLNIFANRENHDFFELSNTQKKRNKTFYASPIHFFNWTFNYILL